MISVYHAKRILADELRRKSEYPRNGDEWWEAHGSALVNPYGQKIRLYDSSRNSVDFTLTSRDRLSLPGLSVYRVNYHIEFDPDGTRNHVPNWATKLVIRHWIDPSTLRVTFEVPVTVKGGQEIAIVLPEAVSFEDCGDQEYWMFSNIHTCCSEKMGTHNDGPKIVPKPRE
jgi:hypothetical protein